MQVDNFGPVLVLTLKHMNKTFFLLFKNLQKQWTKRWVLLYDISDCGVPRLETFDSKEQAKKDSSKGMIIALNTDVHKIVPSHVPNKKDFTIDIVMGGEKVHTFAVGTQAEQDAWLNLMRRVANLGGKRCSATPPTKHVANR